LDPSISMVRHAADTRIRIEPIMGRQPLAFVGTLWEGKKDGWEVRKEFDLLHQAMNPVAGYIQPVFAVASSANGLGATDRKHAAIFHYSGHCDFDERGRAFLLRELPTSRPLSAKYIYYVDELAISLAGTGTRLAVMSACNSGYWAAVKPLLDAGIPAVLGVNGAVVSQSTIEFCAKLYESLAVGLTLDEAVGRARIHLMEWGRRLDLFDWGLFMVHMPSPEATLFPRAATTGVASHQMSIRQNHAETISNTLRLAKELDGMDFGEIMSELSKRRVLILGRFTGRRLEVLKGIKAHLEKHPNRYIPELFTFQRPESRDLVESIIGFAALSRFVIADLSEPKSVQSELEAIVPHFQSVPMVPVINRTGKEYAAFSSVQRRENVVKPTVRYLNLGDLIKKLDDQVVPLAEKKLTEVRPAGRA
ncbi:MAG: CHAT domain-containing protein, partial [Nitrospiraceae bacterium]